MTVTLRPGDVSPGRLARDLARRHACARSGSCEPAVAASAAAVARILARGEPVYGINTGFGKLASVRIAAADLAQSAAQHRAVATRPASASRRPRRPCG